MLESPLTKTFVVSLAIGILLGSAGISFVGFERAPEMIRPDDRTAQLGPATVSPDGRWSAVHAWIGEFADPDATGSFLIDLETFELHPLPGVVPMPSAWDAVGNLRVLSRGQGDMRTIDPATREVLESASQQSEVRFALARDWAPRWCEREQRTLEDGSLVNVVTWEAEDVSAEFPALSEHDTQVCELEGIVIQAVSDGSSMQIERHDLLSDTARVVLEGLAPESCNFRISRDGSALIVVERTTCQVIDAESGAVLAGPWMGGWAKWVEGHGARLVLSERRGAVELRDLEQDQIVSLGQSSRASTWRLTVLPDKRLLIQKGRTLDLHDADGRRLQTLFPLQRADV